MFAAVIFAAIDQIARAGAQRIVGLAERRHAAVAVIVHADIEPDFRHPLGVAHRAGPGAAHFLRRAPAAIDDLQRVDQFGFPIGAAARLVPGQRGERGKYRAHMVLLHQRIAIGGLDAPQRQQRAALDAEILFDPREQRLVLSQRFLAGDDAPVRDAAVDVLPDLLVEFRLLLHLLEHGHVGLDAAHHAGLGRVRNALCQRAGAKTVAPLVEAGRGGGERRQGSARAGRRRRGRIAARRGGSGISENQDVSSDQSSGGRRARQKPMRRGTSHPAANLWRFWTASAGP